MVHRISTRWAALGAVILFSPCTRTLLADGVEPAAKPAPVFLSRQAPPPARPAPPARRAETPVAPATAATETPPAASAAPAQQPAAVIIYVPAGAQSLDLQALLAASTAPTIAGRNQGPKPEPTASARPSGSSVSFEQPMAAGPAPAPGLPPANAAMPAAMPRLLSQMPQQPAPTSGYLSNPARASKPRASLGSGL